MNANQRLSFLARSLGLPLILCSIASFAHAGPLPVYEVMRAATRLQIDGTPDDRAWSEAHVIRNFAVNLNGSAAKLETTAQVLYDDHFIYFAFRCTDENVWATLSRRDEHLWKEEVVEVFLQADPHQTNYIELEVNPLGTMLDIYLVDVRKPLHYQSWNSEKMKWAVQVDGTVDGKGGDRGWTCEIALPLEEIVTAAHNPPRAGDRWRLNLYRVERLPTSLEIAWSPTLRNDFHVPRRFGEIVFK